jgi:DNA-binding transcriptional LysR family regulator
MNQLTEIRVFVRAIERGTFALAASDLGLTPSAISKLISRLEMRLGGVVALWFATASP